MSILSFPNRGHWGDANWRGNCSGHIYAELFKTLQPKVFTDPMVGSGTSVQVANELGIEAHGLDLHSGFNILRDSILQKIGKESDLVLSHPPYAGMVIYSGEVWGKAHPDDLSRCVSDEDFHEKLQVALLNQREATKSGGYYGTIIGDWRRNNIYTSYQAECIARMPSNELAAVLIKQQHNTMSDLKIYGRMKLPRILHEYVLLWQKPTKTISYLGDLCLLAKQQHKRLISTWKSLVRCVLMSLGGQAGLPEIYQKVAKSAPSKLNENPSWQAKVRQVLNQNKQDFLPVSRGVWQLA